LPFPRIEPRFLGLQAHNTITIRITHSQVYVLDIIDVTFSWVLPLSPCTLGYDISAPWREAFLEIRMFWYLRKCTGKTRRDRIINTQIRGILSEEPVTKTAKRRELRWLGHLIRMDSCRSLSRYEKQRVGGRGVEEGQG